MFNQFGDLERVMLRRGNHHSAKFWRRVLLPVIARYRELKIPKFFRGDAAFALPKLFRLLEAESYWYAIRLKANAVLERRKSRMKDTQSRNRLYRLSAFAITPARPATFTGPNMTRTFKNPVRCTALAVVFLLAVARGELTWV